MAPTSPFTKLKVLLPPGTHPCQDGHDWTGGGNCTRCGSPWIYTHTTLDSHWTVVEKDKDT